MSIEIRMRRFTVDRGTMVRMDEDVEERDAAIGWRVLDGVLKIGSHIVVGRIQRVVGYGNAQIRRQQNGSNMRVDP